MAADIQGIELLVLAEGRPRDDGSTWKLRVVQWVVDGQSKSVKLEKRKFFKDEYGNLKMGKAEGFSLDDLKSCNPKWGVIADLMKNPPPVVAPQRGTEQAENKIEEVPF